MIHGVSRGFFLFLILTQRLVDDADILTLGKQADDTLGLALQRADEQERHAAYLEHIADFAVLVHIDAVKVHSTLIVLCHLAQDGLQAFTGLAPVGIEVNDHGTLTDHHPIAGGPVGDALPELLLIDGAHGVDCVQVSVIAQALRCHLLREHRYHQEVMIHVLCR